MILICSTVFLVLLGVSLIWYHHVYNAEETTKHLESKIKTFLDLDSTKNEIHSHYNMLMNTHPNMCSRDLQKRHDAYEDIRREKIFKICRIIKEHLGIDEYYALGYIKKNYPELGVENV